MKDHGGVDFFRLVHTQVLEGGHTRHTTGYFRELSLLEAFLKIYDPRRVE